MSASYAQAGSKLDSRVSGRTAPGQSVRPELLTVDVWDTLLRRRCHPDGVKLHVCRHLLLRWSEHLDPVCRDPWILLRLRQEAERQIGVVRREQGFDDEYGHLEAYRRWLELAGFQEGPASPRLEALLGELERTEIEQEKHVSYADPAIGATLRELAAERVLFLSDFYLPASAVRELLGHHGLDEIVSDGLVSCDVGYNKRSGRLFRHLRERADAPGGAHWHIGDNPWSDIQAAREAGIHALHFQPHEEHRRRLAREADFHDRQQALRRATAALADQPVPVEVARQDFYRLGRQCSLLLVGFVLMAMERAVSERVGALYFFTREGEFFLDIYRRLAAVDVLGFAPPPAKLLKVSRLSTFAGSLRAVSTDELMRLWNQYSVQSLQGLLKSLAMEPSEWADAAARHGLDLATPIQYPWQDTRIRAFLDDPEIRERIESHLDARRDALRAYLASVGLDDDGAPIGIVDIGWRGTIQDNLAYALPQRRILGCYLGLNRFLNVQPDNVRKTAYGPNVNESDALCALLDFVAPIEMLCNSPHGSVEGYTAVDGAMEAVRRVDTDENRVHVDYVRHFQAGVLDAVPYWADFLRAHAFSSTELRSMAMETWHEIAHNPPPFLAEAFFRLNHNEVFGVGGFSDKQSRVGLGEVLQAFVSRTGRIRLQAYLSESGWAPGLVRCPEVNWSLRASLRLFLLVQRIKRRLVNR